MIHWFYVWENENTNSKNTHSHVHCSIIYSSQDTKTTYVSTDG